MRSYQPMEWYLFVSGLLLQFLHSLRCFPHFLGSNMLHLAVLVEEQVQHVDCSAFSPELPFQGEQCFCCDLQVACRQYQDFHEPDGRVSQVMGKNGNVNSMKGHYPHSFIPEGCIFCWMKHQGHIQILWWIVLLLSTLPSGQRDMLNHSVLQQVLLCGRTSCTISEPPLGVPYMVKEHITYSQIPIKQTCMLHSIFFQSSTWMKVQVLPIYNVTCSVPLMVVF